MTVLAYRPLGLREFLTAVPAYRALRRAFPGERLVLAAPAALAPLVPLTSALDRIAPTVGLEAPRRVRGLVTVVNLHGAGPETVVALHGLGAERVISFGCADAGVSGPAWVQDEHDVHRWVRLLRMSGIPADATDLLLVPPRVPAPRPGATVVQPGAGTSRGRWPEERFASVAAALTRAGHEVVVTGSREDRAAAERVARRAGLSSDRNLAGRVQPDELAALVAAARLVVSCDTGVAHLASAYAVPSVVLFGPEPPSLWGPPADPRHVALWHGEEHRGWEPATGSLAAISIAEVLDAAIAVTAVAEAPAPPGE